MHSPVLQLNSEQLAQQISRNSKSGNRYYEAILTQEGLASMDSDDLVNKSDSGGLHVKEFWCDRYFDGGGDVPGLNPAIRAVTFRALREGYRVIGIRRGWAGLVDMIRDKAADNTGQFIELTEEMVNAAGRTGGTFLHTSRTNPSKMKSDDVPSHLKDKYSADLNDLTPEVLKNLDFLGIDCLIPIGGDDTLSYGVRLHKEGFHTVAIPKTMDNDVPGTDYCIGFSTCVSRTICSDE